MKSYRKELWFNLPARMELVNITREVESCLRESMTYSPNEKALAIFHAQGSACYQGRTLLRAPVAATDRLSDQLDYAALVNL